MLLTGMVNCDSRGEITPSLLSVLIKGVNWWLTNCCCTTGTTEALSLSRIRYSVWISILMSPPGWAEVPGWSLVSQLWADTGCWLVPVALLKSWPLTHLRTKGFAYKWWSDFSVIWPVSQCHSMPLLDAPFARRSSIISPQVTFNFH